MRVFNTGEIANYGGDNVRIIGREFINTGDKGFFIYEIDVEDGEEYRYVNDFELDAGRIYCPDCEMLTISVDTGECSLCGVRDSDVIGKSVCEVCYGYGFLFTRRLGKLTEVNCSRCKGKGFVTGN